MKGTNNMVTDFKNDVLKQVYDAIKEKYGTTANAKGCYINGVWLSINDIVEILYEVDYNN